MRNLGRSSATPGTAAMTVPVALAFGGRWHKALAGGLVMGLGLYFVEGEGPKFERTVRTMADAEKLAVPDMETELRYVMDAVRVIRRELDGKVPLIGFSGSPWTLACYMVEGGGSDNLTTIKAMALNEPVTLHALLRVMSDRGIDDCVMEVSSHALDQHRVDGIHYSVVAFTNLSHEHLDYHGDMASYFDAKARLFTPEFTSRAVVVVDDDGGRRLRDLAGRR